MTVCFLFEQKAFSSVTVYGIVGKQEQMAATENIVNEAVQPALSWTGPSTNDARMPPKPATPSQMPEIVDTAFFWCSAR